MRFKIKPKMLKFYSERKNVMNVIIDRIDVNKNIIIKLLNIFEFKDIIVITEVEKNSNIFNELKTNNIKYTTAISKEKDLYIEVILMINYTDMKILNSILDSNTEEDIFIYSLKDFIGWEQCLFNSKYLASARKVNKISDFNFEFIPNEGAVAISYNTQVYNPIDINDKIESSILEKY